MCERTGFFRRGLCRFAPVLCFAFAQSGVFACPGGGGRAAFPFCVFSQAAVRPALRACVFPSLGGRRASGAGHSAAKPRACVPPRGFLFFACRGCAKTRPTGRTPARQSRPGLRPPCAAPLCKGGTPYGFNHNKGYFIFLPRCAGACVRTRFPLTRFPLAAGPGRGQMGGAKARFCACSAACLYPLPGTLPCPARRHCFHSMCQRENCAPMKLPGACFPAPGTGPLRARLGFWAWRKRRCSGRFPPLSGGEATKLLLAMLFAGEDRFLLLDEPTNHLDEPAREAVAAYLARKRGSLWPHTTARC